MSVWIAWALLVLGFVYLFTEASIAAPYRVILSKIHWVLSTLVYCPSCTGFWVGLGLALVGINPFETLDPQAWWALKLYGGVGAMGLVATWSAWRGGNPAWAAEAALRGEHDEEEASDVG